jgi:putative nucleotide binding protein
MGFTYLSIGWVLMVVEKSQSGRPYTSRSSAERPSSGGRWPAGKPQSERQSERAPRSSGKGMESSQDREEYVWVLDYLPYGKSVDGTSTFQKKPLVQAVGDKKFTLMELVPKAGVVPEIQSRVYIGPGDRNEIDHVKQRIGYSDLTTGANLELPFILEACVRHKEERFVKFFNEAHSITTRLHMLELLPGIGKKLMWSIIDEHKKGDFKSFQDIRERIPSLHDPAKVISHRIAEELKDDFIKYRLFTVPPRHQGPSDR